MQGSPRPRTRVMWPIRGHDRPPTLPGGHGLLPAFSFVLKEVGVSFDAVIWVTANVYAAAVGIICVVNWLPMAGLRFQSIAVVVTASW